MWHFGMHSNMNFPAPLAAVMFLALLGGATLLMVGILVSWCARRPRFAALLAAVLASGGLLYAALLFGFSLGSREIVLMGGQEKYFCEIDCHLAYSVTTVSESPDIAGVTYMVTLRTRFDETTISSQRPKDAPLRPSPRRVELIDDRGSRYSPLSMAGGDLTAELIPGESYQSELRFHLPQEARGLKLLLYTAPAWPDYVVIGDENSWLHKKTYFSISRQRSALNVRSPERDVSVASRD